MSVPRVQEVRVEPDAGAGLTGGLLAPREGTRSQSLLVRGWVLGGESRALAVEAVQGDRVVRVAPVREPSPAIAEASPARPEAAHCEFITRLHTAALDPDRPLVLRAALADGRRAGLATIRLERGPAPAAGQGDRGRPERHSLRDRIEQVLAQLGASQGVDPGRADPRLDSLDTVELAGKRVLVLESGTGDLARAARARGAALVDGVEPDERLLLAARLLNACHGTTRVSFAGSLPEPRDSYDVVLEP